MRLHTAASMLAKLCEDIWRQRIMSMGFAKQSEKCELFLAIAGARRSDCLVFYIKEPSHMEKKF